MEERLDPEGDVVKLIEKIIDITEVPFGEIDFDRIDEAADDFMLLGPGGKKDIFYYLLGKKHGKSATN